MDENKQSAEEWTMSSSELLRRGHIDPLDPPKKTPESEGKVVEGGLPDEETSPLIHSKTSTKN